MEKVKITQEQHMSLKYATTHKSNQSIVKSRVFGDIDKELSELRLDELIRALYIGYEVEPEFKVGNWVVTKTGHIGEVEFINEIEGWANIGYSKETKERGVCLAKTFNLSEIERHATSSEIAEEKERRWWRRHGRGLLEYKMADLVTVKGARGIFEVVEMHDADAVVVTRDFCDSQFTVLAANLRLACPAENRLDVSE